MSKIYLSILIEKKKTWQKPTAKNDQLRPYMVLGQPKTDQRKVVGFNLMVGFIDHLEHLQGCYV